MFTQNKFLMSLLLFPLLTQACLSSSKSEEDPNLRGLGKKPITTSTASAAFDRAMSICNDTNTIPAGNISPKIALQAAFRLIDINTYVLRYAPEEKQDAPPPLPQGGTHPYEWDSLRSADQMLSDRNGGSCGTFGLSIASVAIAGGFPAEDMYILGAVQKEDYKDICPSGKGSPRRESFEGYDFVNQTEKTVTYSDASGHVFLLIKLDGVWKLFNSTDNPWVRSDPNGQPAGMPMPCKYTLDSFEQTPFLSPGDISKTLDSNATSPIAVPLEKFPSLKDWMGQGLKPMVIFAMWKVADYPIHTIDGRNDLVASGAIGNKTCRWDPKEVSK